MTDHQTAPVTVIIPCYNCCMTITRAVESVFNQTLRPAEVFLINDASSDSTSGILQQLASRFDKWITILELKSNSGPSTARNSGWNKATQPYIAFLDADDSWHPQKIEIQYGWMKSRPDIYLTAHRYTCDACGNFETVTTSEVKTTNVSFRNLLFSNRFSTPTVMLKNEIPVRFQEGKRYAEDYLLWLSIAAISKCELLDIRLANLHKAPYGASGLSADMWGMEKGELSTYTELYNRGHITQLIFVILIPFSLLKFLLRLIRMILKG